MSYRVTKKVLRNKFEWLAKDFNWNYNNYDDKTTKYYMLDHNSVYGGYRIDYRMIGSTGEDWLAGPDRMSAREMKCFMRGMSTALQLLRDEGKLKEDV